MAVFGNISVESILRKLKEIKDRISANMRCTRKKEEGAEGSTSECV